MPNTKRVWVFNYAYKHKEYIGDFKGCITVGTFLSENEKTAANRAKIQVQSLLKKRNVNLVDGYDLELTLDMSYTV